MSAAAPFASAPFVTQKLIRFHHCDPAGIVFYPQYFVLMNELVEDWFNRALGVDFARFHTEMRRGIPMAHIECDFLAPSKIGETRVRATLVVVHSSLDTRRAVPLTAELREKLARFVR